MRDTQLSQLFQCGVVCRLHRCKSFGQAVEIVAGFRQGNSVVLVEYVVQLIFPFLQSLDFLLRCDNLLDSRFVDLAAKSNTGCRHRSAGRLGDVLQRAWQNRVVEFHLTGEVTANDRLNDWSTSDRYAVVAFLRSDGERLLDGEFAPQFRMGSTTHSRPMRELKKRIFGVVKIVGQFGISQFQFLLTGHYGLAVFALVQAAVFFIDGTFFTFQLGQTPRQLCPAPFVVGRHVSVLHTSLMPVALSLFDEQDLATLIVDSIRRTKMRDGVLLEVLTSGRTGAFRSRLDESNDTEIRRLSRSDEIRPTVELVVRLDDGFVALSRSSSTFQRRFQHVVDIRAQRFSKLDRFGVDCFRRVANLVWNESVWDQHVARE